MIKRVIGIVLIIIGIALILHNFGYIQFSTRIPNLKSKLSVLTPSGSAGIELVLKRPPQYMLSLIQKGGSYVWELRAKNTGSIDWDNSWVTVRIGKNGASITDKSEENIFGEFKVEKCEYGIDVPECREDIERWHLQYFVGSCRETREWMHPSCENKVCSLVFGSLSKGETKYICFKLTVPENIEKGQYPLIVNLMANVGGIYAVDGIYDILTVQEIPPSPKPSIELIAGFISLVSGLAINVESLIKKR